MGTFVATYVIVWLAVVLYVARLNVGQRRLQRDLEALQAQLDPSRDRTSPASKAA